MSEKALADRVMKILKPLDACRVENPCLPGTPDVNYVWGWIELKQVDNWPVNSHIPLRVPHFTPQQRIWLERRVRRGGKAHVLIQVAREYILLSGDVAAIMLGESTRQELIESAVFHVTAKELPEALLDACNA